MRKAATIVFCTATLLAIAAFYAYGLCLIAVRLHEWFVR